jgi:TRAP-type C4-dicarboxylate transport system permease small subunit
MERISNIINRIAEVAIFVIISIMAVVVLFEVIFRYTLLFPLFWTEEFARYCLVWSSLLGAGIALKRGEHIAVTFLVHRLPKGVAMGTALSVHIFIAALLVVLLWGGINLVILTHHQSSPAMRIPMSWPYMAVPIGSLIMLFHQVTFIYRQSREMLAPAGYNHRVTEG